MQLGNQLLTSPQGQARPLHLIHEGASSPFCLTPSFCPIMGTLTRCDTPASCGMRPALYPPAVAGPRSALGMIGQGGGMPTAVPR